MCIIWGGGARAPPNGWEAAELGAYLPSLSIFCAIDTKKAEAVW